MARRRQAAAVAGENGWRSRRRLIAGYFLDRYRLAA